MRRCHKYLIQNIKYAPYILVLCLIAHVGFDYFGVITEIPRIVGGLQIMWIYLLSSFSFKYCTLHRIPLYFVIVTNILFIIDWIFKLGSAIVLNTTSLLFIITIIIYIYYVRRNC